MVRALYSERLIVYAMMWTVLVARKLGIDPHKVEVLQVHHAVEKSTKMNIKAPKKPFG